MRQHSVHWKKQQNWWICCDSKLSVQYTNETSELFKGGSRIPPNPILYQLTILPKKPIKLKKFWFSVGRHASENCQRRSATGINKNTCLHCTTRRWLQYYDIPIIPSPYVSLRCVVLLNDVTFLQGVTSMGCVVRITSWLYISLTCVCRRDGWTIEIPSPSLFVLWIRTVNNTSLFLLSLNVLQSQLLFFSFMVLFLDYYSFV